MAKAKKFDYIVGIDPGQTSGVARFYLPVHTYSRAQHLPITDASRYLLDYFGYPSQDRILFVIERSTSRTPQFAAHRAYATSWADAVKKACPRRNKIVFVSPNVWQGKANGLCVCHPDKPKPGYEPYTEFADRVTGIKGLTEDEAAAVCLVEYGRRFLLNV